MRASQRAPGKRRARAGPPRRRARASARRPGGWPSGPIPGHGPSPGADLEPRAAAPPLHPLLPTPAAPCATAFLRRQTARRARAPRGQPRTRGPRPAFHRQTARAPLVASCARVLRALTSVAYLSFGPGSLGFPAAHRGPPPAQRMLASTPPPSRNTFHDFGVDPFWPFHLQERLPRAPARRAPGAQGHSNGRPGPQRALPVPPRREPRGGGGARWPQRAGWYFVHFIYTVWAKQHPAPQAARHFVARAPLHAPEPVLAIVRSAACGPRHSAESSLVENGGAAAARPTGRRARDTALSPTRADISPLTHRFAQHMHGMCGVVIH